MQTQSTQQRWLNAAAALSALAGLIHLAVAPNHFEEWIGYGLFFFLAATCQLLFAVGIVVFKPLTRQALWAGIMGNAAIIVLWAVTRTVGIPFFGPEAGEVEPIGVLDSISKVAELALIVCLFVLLRANPASAARSQHQ
jgi:hypothetical protein